MYQNKGFTLIELVTTLAVASILLAIAIPMASESLAGFQLNASSARLAQDIRTVSQQSLTQDYDYYYIQLYADNNRYRIGDILDSDNSRWVDLPGWVELDGSNFDLQRLSFSGKGKPITGGYIRLKNKNNNKFKYVIVAAITGRVRVSDQPPLSNEYL